jgi:phospholipid-binding lipoprotein MlaA
VVRVVDRRAQLLDASTLLEDAALDKYDFVRDAYLQRRQSQIDGASGGREQKEEAIKPDGRWLSRRAAEAAAAPCGAAVWS